MNNRPCLLTITACLILASTHAGGEQLDELRQTFRDKLTGCTAQFGYDPKNAGDLGVHDLGAGELEWRECAYTAVRETFLPASKVPEIYEEFISRDRQWTEAVTEGEMTRVERQRQIDFYIENIKLTERLQGNVESSAQLQNFVDDEMRRMREMRFETRVPRMPGARMR